MTSIRIDIDDADARAALSRLAELGGNLRPAMEDIGELLIVRTRERFAAGVGPDGTPWAPKSPVTLQQYRRRRVNAPKPLIGESKRLSTEIAKRVGDDSVEVGSALVYAATQQLGALKGSFGRTAKGAPIPWGTIPARPFLGISDQDRTDIRDILLEHLEEAL